MEHTEISVNRIAGRRKEAFGLRRLSRKDVTRIVLVRRSFVRSLWRGP